MIRPRVLLDAVLTLGLGAVLAELLWVEGELARLRRIVDPGLWAEHNFEEQG